MSLPSPTLPQLAEELGSGRTTSRALVEECLGKIADPEGEGARAFLGVSSQALAVAESMDKLRRAGAAPSPYAGIPISIKDLFDVQGEVTAAGSRVLANAPKATTDAVSVSYLRRAGFVLIGRTNMSEFAYSGLGLNPHFGTPRNYWDRASSRVPGGSSSGAAISVADGMAHAALGTDTGGSTRIPAAFNGLVGFKPTASRVSRAGCVPLSFTLDSVGPIARSVACCNILDDILSGGSASGLPLPDRSIGGLRFAVPQSVVLDGLDPQVTKDFAGALSRLSLAGARIEDVSFSEFKDVAPMNSKGGFTAAESYSWHREILASKTDEYDPRVRSRIMRGKEQSASDYIDLVNQRAAFIDSVRKNFEAYDAVVCPTVAIIPPPMADLEEDTEFSRINLLALRNPTIVNMFDGCAISIPINSPGGAPVGLMLASVANRDKDLMQIAAAVERDIISR